MATDPEGAQALPCKVPVLLKAFAKFLRIPLSSNKVQLPTSADPESSGESGGLRHSRASTQNLHPESLGPIPFL